MCSMKSKEKESWWPTTNVLNLCSDEKHFKIYSDMQQTSFNLVTFLLQEKKMYFNLL